MLVQRTLMPLFRNGSRCKTNLQPLNSTAKPKTKTRQAMHVSYNIEACLCNHCCSGKTVSITYAECVFVALVTQHAMCMCHVVMRPVWLYYSFPHYLINYRISEQRLLNTKCVLIFSTIFV